ncbi:MAG: sigma-70 family RNA polymerase sigma factor [Acidimicrobiia bacterium]|nr:sigma-70 family RNA polymerase sigma factor [Acidimicrobiia bacterium]
MGDADAAEFCDAIRDRLVGSLTLYCGDRGVAEELAQDALVRVWEQWPKVGVMAAPEAWAFRVGTNLARSWGRRRSAERRARGRLGVTTEAVRDPDVAEVRAVRAAVAALPPRQRAAIVARYYIGLDVAATAVALDCAEGTVKSTTHQALAALRAAGLIDTNQMDEVDA